VAARRSPVAKTKKRGAPKWRRELATTSSKGGVGLIKKRICRVPTRGKRVPFRQKERTLEEKGMTKNLVLRLKVVDRWAQISTGLY